MNEENGEGLDLRTASSPQVLRAIRRGVKDALRLHKRAGNPVVVWDRATGKTVLIPPEEIPDDPEESPRAAQTSANSNDLTRNGL